MSLSPLLKPRSIAIIGASDNKGRIGGVPVDLLKRAGFAKIYPVNPKNETVQGLTAYKDIESVPEVVDLAIVAVSADATLPILERCHALGIPAAMAYASGYAETNEAEGAKRQEDLIAFTVRTGMKVAGPNCMGNANFSDNIFTTFGQSFQPGEPAGHTALLTQSGNMCATLFRMARRAGVTFSHVINTMPPSAILRSCGTDRSFSMRPRASGLLASCWRCIRLALPKKALRPRGHTRQPLPEIAPPMTLHSPAPVSRAPDRSPNWRISPICIPLAKAKFRGTIALC
jgi:predicted CoA-binding protein